MLIVQASVVRVVQLVCQSSLQFGTGSVDVPLEWTTATSGKMGCIDYFNCGIDSITGWSPPYIPMDQVVSRMADLKEAIKKPGSPFRACEQFVPIFEKYAQVFGVPAILMASFALQESTCNPSTTGGAGEAGLMQLTPDKCYDAPNGNCYDPDYNISAGFKYFAERLAANNGDFLLTCGNYNGWFKGMTYANGPCCRCQNNLDYLQQLANGFLQNVNAYDPNHRLGKYFNLDKCNHGST
ncbi:glycoside hydrolase family 23 protein [Desarmillaria tabescens]|uniref:Glycoside hydrolase family 23 protein n=1 Tax=Armillaria tabescens TaxID=1929756 RepID=A0AA39N941_ARMTA|nr:glycoside hydrolase family 23 protein [Desarmillaria tabescens]KAK0461289.1 glycoside hydrolase family 23 protein [Desarmillaria tabescens]